MEYTQLGRTGLKVSRIGFGSWAIGGPVDFFGIPVGWDGVNDADSQAAIHRALDLGITLFDSADVYGGGHSEELLGHVLHGQDCIVATKAGNARKEGRGVKDFSEKHLRTQIESSLRRLKRDTIDIFQLHNPPPEVWQTDEVFGLLDIFKQEGKIRFAGVSITTPEEGIHLIRNGKVDLLQVLFNILNQAPADELLPLAEKTGTGILARVPLASGLLTGKITREHEFSAHDNRRNYLTSARLQQLCDRLDRVREIILPAGMTMLQAALAFVLRFPVVPIPGAKTMEQVEQNVGACEIALPDYEFNALRNEFRSDNFFLRHKVHV